MYWVQHVQIKNVKPAPLIDLYSSHFDMLKLLLQTRFGVTLRDLREIYNEQLEIIDAPAPVCPSRGSVSPRKPISPLEMFS